MDKDEDENIQAFLKVLDPTNNFTGGGTASAVAAAMAAALVGMVARLSIGRKGMERDGYYHDISREAKALSVELFIGGREDSQAFEAVLASYRLPKETEGQRRARRATINRAMVRATQVPLDNAEACKRVLDLCARLEGRSNPNAASDLECALHLARAGLLGCLGNVEVNLSSIQDEKSAAALAERTRRLRKYAKAGHTRI